MRVARVVTLAVVAGASLALCGSAWAAVTPGWECVPTTANQPVLSGGTNATPSCTAGTTAVLAPTYVSSGVGGKPTVEFSTVNVQVISGSGATNGTVNGEGNLIVGYAENPNNRVRTGSNDLIIGTNGGWSSYGQLVGGNGNTATGSYGVAFGASNTAKGRWSFVAGLDNQASGQASSVSGGEKNTASGSYASVSGGESNNAVDQLSAILGGCQNVTGSATPGIGCVGNDEVVAGGFENTADTASGGTGESVFGGTDNTADTAGASVFGGGLNHATGDGGDSSVFGGQSNTASGLYDSVSGGVYNTASNAESSVSGGEHNTASGPQSNVSGGFANAATDQWGSILGGCENLTGTGSNPNASIGCRSTAPMYDTISGGENNQSQGVASSLLGGLSITLTGTGTHSP